MKYFVSSTFAVLCLCVFSISFGSQSAQQVDPSFAKVELACPWEAINPCICVSWASEKIVECRGKAVTVEVLQKLAESFRTFKNSPFDSLIIWETSLTQLDLTHFTNLTLKTLSVFTNIHLTYIIEPSCSGCEGSIDVENLDIFGNTLLTDDGFGDCLKYFSPRMKHLDLSINKLQGSGQRRRQQQRNKISPGSSGEVVEFLPGLAALTRLEKLSLSGNNITDIGGGQFRRNPKLKQLNLERNGLRNIGYNAFLFDEEEQGQDYPRTIHLGSNELVSDDFDRLNETGLILNKKPTILNLINNNVSFLPESSFLFFLLVHPQNSLFLSGNPLICDENMSWLKIRRQSFEGRVLDAYCSNDPGKTVFDSSLIP